jgi:hypothetical protein
MSGNSHRRRPFGAKKGKKLKNIHQIMGPSTSALPNSQTATSTISQKFTQLPAESGRHSKISQVHVPRPPPPPVFPTPRAASAGPDDAADPLSPIDPLVEPFDVYNADPDYFDDTVGATEGDDVIMDEGNEPWDEDFPGVAAAEEDAENHTHEGIQEKEKLAGVCIYFWLLALN